ncbi:adhesin, partial [Pelomonas sp. HMWF004]
ACAAAALAWACWASAAAAQARAGAAASEANVVGGMTGAQAGSAATADTRAQQAQARAGLGGDWSQALRAQAEQARTQATTGEQAGGPMALGAVLNTQAPAGAPSAAPGTRAAATSAATPQAQAASAAGASTGGSALAQSGGTVSAVQPNTVLPSSSLFRVQPGASATSLVETDPAFTSRSQWLSSDYMLQALSFDPTTTQKRLGDGFYEQRLVREQVLALTGQQRLGDYSNDAQQYQALMDAGITYAQAHNLRPGVALSAEQMAELTTDMVLLVEQTVTLPDGSTQRVLVPQLYARVQADDLSPGGALLSGRNVVLDVSGDFTNSGSVRAQQVMSISAQSLSNSGGMQANVMGLQTTGDLTNRGDLMARQALAAQAGGDLNLLST